MYGGYLFETHLMCSLLSEAPRDVADATGRIVLTNQITFSWSHNAIFAEGKLDM